MKNILILLTILSLSFSLEASKKNKRRQISPEFISYISGVYFSDDNSVRKVGTIYMLTIHTLKENVTIDSVWFGATPVPCDLLEVKTNHKIEWAKQKGTYIVKANKNLYANFNQQIDSTAAYQRFKAPFEFHGDVVIMYKVDGKRYYKTANKVTRGKAKGMR